MVITGSKQGITNPPGNPAYNASKAAVRSVAEHLSYDLRGERGLSVHLLVPGWTWTGMTGHRPGGAAGEKPDGAWWPEQVVDYLEQKIGEGQFWVLCPDNDVSEKIVSFCLACERSRDEFLGEMTTDNYLIQDRGRILWGATDAIEGRPPLTRWRDEWKEKHKEWLASYA